MNTTLHLRNAGGGAVPNRHVFQCEHSLRLIEFSEITQVEQNGVYTPVTFFDDLGDGSTTALQQPYISYVWLHMGHSVPATITDDLIILHL